MAVDAVRRRFSGRGTLQAHDPGRLQLSAQRGTALGAILAAFKSELAEVADRMVAAYCHEIPAYAGMSTQVLADVTAISRRNLVLLLSLLEEDRFATDLELAPLAESARRRVYEGASLDDLLHAYRLGTAVAWEAIVASSDSVEGGHEAALEIAGRLMRFVDQVSTSAAHSYAVERETAATDEEEMHRQVLDRLLADDLDRAHVLAESLGFALPVAADVAAVRIPADSQSTLGTLARQLRQEAAFRGAVIARRDNTILALLPPGVSVHDLETYVRSRSVDALIAWSGAAGQLLTAQIDELQTLLRLCPERTGLVSLDDLLPEAVITQVGGRTAQLLGSRTAILRDPVAESACLEETLLAFVERNGSITAVASDLYVHRNTVIYRLKRIHQLTGWDPHRSTDLFLLWASVRGRQLDLANGDPSRARTSRPR